MRNRLPGLAWLAALCLGLAPAGAQTKPPESTSKVKKVLLYNKVGGYVPNFDMADVKEVFSKLSAAKGFTVEQVDQDAGITLDYLKQFQVIVWNNNTNGGLSLPSVSARQAVLDYVDQGGGWMLICFAGDHHNSWPGWAERLGTNLIRHSEINRGEVVLDGAARAHGELKWMLNGFPDVFEMNSLWFSFENTVRPLPGMTVVATAREIPGITNVVSPVGDGSKDNVYIWAREILQGRLIYNAIGYGRTKIMEQQDSIVPRLYWENLRYAAGDYRNGCTNPSNPGFDSSARVHIETMCATTGLTAASGPPNVNVLKGSRRIRLAHAPSVVFTARMRDIRGVKIWERTMPAGTGEIALDDAIKSGVYHFEVLGSTHAVHQRLLVP